MTGPLRILLVEDNALLCRILKKIIAERGHHCDVASSAEEAAVAIEASTFHLVVSDVHLGSESGIDLMRKVGQLSPSTTRILMSGGNPDDAALEVAHGHLLKPFDAGQLFALIDARH
jgi:DNA-binding NtrC family response regulator